MRDLNERRRLSANQSVNYKESLPCPTPLTCSATSSAEITAFSASLLFRSPETSARCRKREMYSVMNLCHSMGPERSICDRVDIFSCAMLHIMTIRLSSCSVVQCSAVQCSAVRHIVLNLI
jgi:hypothetical protein